MSTIPARLARNLKTMRTWRKLSQDTTAHMLGVKRSSYSGYENGTAEPGLGILFMVQTTFGVGMDVLLTSDLSTLSEYALGQVMRGSTRARHIERNNATITA